MKKLRFCFLFAILLVLAACNLAEPKEPITADKFISVMEENGFTVQDAADQFEEGVVEAVHIANNGNYQIEFYIVPSVEQAQSAFAQNIEAFKSMDSGVSSNSTVQLANYSFFEQSSKTSFQCVSRIDNTFVYLNIPAEYKKEAKDIIQELGY